MEKGITLHEAEDDSEPIVNLSEPGFSHGTVGLVGCTHGLLGEWKESLCRTVYTVQS